MKIWKYIYFYLTCRDGYIFHKKLGLTTWYLYIFLQSINFVFIVSYFTDSSKCASQIKYLKIYFSIDSFYYLFYSLVLVIWIHVYIFGIFCINILLFKLSRPPLPPQLRPKEKFCIISLKNKKSSKLKILNIQIF